MSVWDTYEDRVKVHGTSRREIALKQTYRNINNHVVGSLSYQDDIIVGGEKRTASIINSDNLDEKTMISLPGEDFDCGDYVEWAGNHWLIIEKDANTEVYTRVKLWQCNHLLKWIDSQHKIHEQWCIVKDGTKYLTGTYEDRSFIVTRGDARIGLTIGRNKDTAKFNRKSRFLIDDDDHYEKQAYSLTKPMKIGGVFDNKGVYSFVLQEVVSTLDDNMDLGIADYYLHFPELKPDIRDGETQEIPHNGSTGEDDKNKEVWL